MAQTNFRTAYGARKRVSLAFSEPSLTRQSFKEECDINNIMRKYQKTGLIDHVNKHNGQYADLGDGITFEAAMELILRAEESFSSLPSSVRRQFNNDPAEFLEFVNNPENGNALVAMGLAKPRPTTVVETQPEPEASKKAFKPVSEKTPTPTQEE